MILMRMQKSSCKKATLIIVLFVLLLTVSIIALSSGISTENSGTADALKDVTKAVKAGGGAEAWDSKTGTFNYAVLSDLKTKIFGTQNPVDYIKKSYDSITGSYIVQAPQINAAVGNAENGMVIKLGGLDWMVSCLTLADMPNSKDNVIISLYLCNPLDIKTKFYTSATETKGNSAYSRSILRKSLLTESTFSMFSSGNFAEQYLVQPKNVLYQRKQILKNYESRSSWQYCAANEALDEMPASMWYKGFSYSNSDSFDGIKYNAWGEDYIWIPSISEVGTIVVSGTTYVSICVDKNIWKLTPSQLSHNGSSSAWFRTADVNHYKQIYTIYPSGARHILNTTQEAVIRPAIHLNLTKALGTTLIDPENVTTVYNGVNQTVGNFNLTNQPDWYNATFYPNGSSDAKRATVTYKPVAPLDVTNTIPKNAGEYVVEVSLSTWRNAIDQEVDAECASQGITDNATINEIKNMRRPKFSGTAKTETDSKGYTYSESESVRYFIFKITPKPFSLIKTNKDNAAPSVTVNTPDICASDAAAASSMLSFYYESTDGRGYSSANAPIAKKGAYKVTVTCTNPNYQIKSPNGTNGTMYYNFTLSAARRALPYFEPASRNYKYGADLKFVLNEGLASGESGIFKYTKPNAAELPTEYANYNKFAFTWDDDNLLAVATKAGKYLIKVEIVDPDNNEWSDVPAGSATSSTFRYIEFEVKPLPIELSFTADRVENGNGILDCMYEEDRDVTVGCDAPESDDDTIYVKFMARRNSRDTVIFDCLKINRTSVEDAFLDFNCKLAISNIVLEADYELVVDFADGYEKNENYELKLSQPITLHVSANAGESKVLWRLSHDGKTVASFYVAETDKNYVYDVPAIFDGKEFAFTARATGIGCDVDTSYNSMGFVKGYKTVDASDNAVAAINAGTYTTYVRLLKSDGSSSDPVVYSVKFTIDKALIDLSKVKWLSDGQLEFTGAAQKPSFDAKTLPNGLKPAITATSGTVVGQGGPASVIFSLEGDALNNYVCPVQGDLSTYLLDGKTPTEEWDGWSIEWQIVAKELDLYYMPLEINDRNGVPILAQQFADPDNAKYIAYEYYECDQSGNITNTTPVTELIVEDNRVKYYVAKAVIAPQYAGNVVLNIPSGINPDGYSAVFEVGTSRQEVKLAAKNAKVKYNGKNQPFGITVTQGTLDESAFNFSYQSGTTTLGTAPKDVGVYTVTVTLKPSYSANYYIKDGKIQFTYEIEKNIIDVNWNDSLKPPALSVNAVQIKGIEYEYKDGSGNTIQFADLAAGNTYYVRAKIKDLKNFEFEPNPNGNEAYTDWKEFSVANNDVLYDPTDPGNPNYPKDDPDNPDDPNLTPIKIVWHGSSFVFNGQLQGPTYSITDMNGNPLTGVNVTIGGIKKAMYAIAGGYTITATAPSGYKIVEGASFTYNIVKNEETGKGGLDDPENPNSPNYDPGYDPSKDPNVKPGADGEKKPFPLWQIIVGSASLVLAILFACLWASFDSKRRKANEEAARYKSNAMAAIAPVGVIGSEIAAGLSVSAWSAIAFSLLGFAVVMFALMLVARSRCLKAVKEKEQAYADMVKAEKAAEKEERLRREQEEKEERRRRDDDMKMMLASMMNAVNTRPAPAPQQSSGDNVELIVGRVVQALLPTMQAMLPQGQNEIHYIPYQGTASEAAFSEEDEDLEDDEWDTEDDEQDEAYEAELMDDSLAEEPEVIADVPKRMPSNFRARLKVSSEKNRITYSIIKNEFCAQKGVSYRASGRVEKVKFHGDLIAVIGVAKRSIKLWLALDPNEFDRERYFHKDVSDKPRYEKVPMYLRVGSERAQKRVLELLEALFEKFGIERRHKYTEKPIQELIFTLKGNKLLKDKEKKHLLCESVHVHDADTLDNETAENCIEIKDIAPIENENFESISLDVLDENFLDGQRITLDRLKKKGLVSEDCNGIRIIAGSRISKPLAIHANEFTLPAVKMIVLTGGRAVQLVQF